MDAGANRGWEEELAGALDWWRDAGVDAAFADDPRQWLAAPAAPEPDRVSRKPEGDPRAPSRQAMTPPPPAPTALPKPPDELDAFHQWWLGEPALDEGRLSGRVPPRGGANAEVMIVVPEPEAEDTERLLSGRQGRLLDAMLDAMGLPSEQVYVASLLPRCLPGFDRESGHARAMGAILRHHVALAAPARLIVLGFNILPLIGHEPPQRSANLQQFNHEGRTLPMLAARSLSSLLERPGGKAALWQTWLDWTSE